MYSFITKLATRQTVKAKTMPNCPLCIILMIFSVHCCTISGEEKPWYHQEWAWAIWHFLILFIWWPLATDFKPSVIKKINYCIEKSIKVNDWLLILILEIHYYSSTTVNSLQCILRLGRATYLLIFPVNVMEWFTVFLTLNYEKCFRGVAHMWTCGHVRTKL